MKKIKYIALFTISFFSLIILSFISKEKFHFRNGAYRIWVIDEEAHDIGVSEYIQGNKGYYFTFDKDSTEHDNCHESAEHFDWEIDKQKNQLILNNYEVWYKDTCGGKLSLAEPNTQYFNIVFKAKDSLVTKHYKDIISGDTHYYAGIDTSLYIWVWDSKLTSAQKKLIK